ncbi:peptidase family C78-domain-containing protein [Vararia minispora EC-137]|uniref:Peptidase family C78-domain-containing protein n=1 Tax=Vararia minispora EC-137 TaxID=1314806 RepID=A0ACB8QAK9_9AGAM|nr:peptidase family C78-domain-containing protein [Vararia minispora EC-137]
MPSSSVSFEFSSRPRSRPSDKSSGHDVFWHPSLLDPPPHNCTPGLITLLRRALVSQHECGHIQRAVLCTNRAVHISREDFDSRWGCGYRNYMMACAVLMDQRSQDAYAALFKRHEPPGVRSLQSLIERAWEAGFDEEGAGQLRRRLYDTTKWIGTVELFVAFTYLGIPSQLADFVLPRRTDTEPLIDWISDYFSPPDQHEHSSFRGIWKDASAVTQTDRLPLVLQHNGHSRTIVGYEINRKGQIVLLVFDPSKRIRPPLRHMALSNFKWSEVGSVAKDRSGTQKLRQHFTQLSLPRHPKHAIPLSSDSRPTKRTRAGATAVVMSRVKPEVIEVGSDGEAVEGAADDHVSMSDSRNLKEKYQILWFPLHDPLTEQEKDARRVITSAKIC